MRYYTDDEIKGMLIERKRNARRKEGIESLVGWLLLFGGVYIISIIGYVAGLN